MGNCPACIKSQFQFGSKGPGPSGLRRIRRIRSADSVASTTTTVAAAVVPQHIMDDLLRPIISRANASAECAKRCLEEAEVYEMNVDDMVIFRRKPCVDSRFLEWCTTKLVNARDDAHKAVSSAKTATSHAVSAAADAAAANTKEGATEAADVAAAAAVAADAATKFAKATAMVAAMVNGLEKFNVANIDDIQVSERVRGDVRLAANRVVATEEAARVATEAAHTAISDRTAVDVARTAAQNFMDLRLKNVSTAKAAVDFAIVAADAADAAAAAHTAATQRQ